MQAPVRPDRPVVSEIAAAKRLRDTVETTERKQGPRPIEPPAGYSLTMDYGFALARRDKTRASLARLELFFCFMSDVAVLVKNTMIYFIAVPYSICLSARSAEGAKLRGKVAARHGWLLPPPYGSTQWYTSLPLSACLSLCLSTGPSLSEVSHLWSLSGRPG